VLEVPQGQEEAQRKRLAKETEQLKRNIANSERQLSDETFLSKAPAKVVESIRLKLADYQAQLRKIDGAS
jgi:valyl-tRNA synthetase